MDSVIFLEKPRLLIEFTILTGNRKGEQFRVYGIMRNINPKSPLPKFEFEQLSMAKYTNSWCGKYTPEGEDWYGNRYTEEDVISSVLADLVAGCRENYSIQSISAPMEIMIHSYQKEKEVKDLNHYIWRKGEVLELLMATDKYAYYSKDDVFAMLNTATKELISDNSFAEDAVWESVEEINAGEERLLYGEDTYNSINSNMKGEI